MKRPRPNREQLRPRKSGTPSLKAVPLVCSSRPTLEHDPPLRKLLADDFLHVLLSLCKALR